MLSVIFRHHLKRGIKKFKSANSDFLWVKIDQHYFGLKKNVCICNTSIPPENSGLHKQNKCDYFATLKAEVAKFSVLGDIMIVGDLNSRTRDLNETYSDVEEITTPR